MKLISEPSVPVKIQKMKQRVRWMHPSIKERGIDQTSLILDDGKEESPDFSFMVIGDSGTKSDYGQHPQRQVMEMLLSNNDDCRFVLHTGDVVYLVGSREYYPANFIEPYREFIVGGENPKSIAYDQMVFKLPILPVLGNHDYYDVPLLYRLVTGSTLSLRRMLRYKDIEVGWHGSNQGDAYTRAFIDYLARMSPNDLKLHLDEYYTAKTDTGRCLRYQPGNFTRLPNRYYTFRYGGIDFFALDSNTFNTPAPLPGNEAGDVFRRELLQRRQELEREELQILAECDKLNSENTVEAEQLADLVAKVDQLNEVKIDIDKQLEPHTSADVDFEQLDWLRSRLIESWHSSNVRGRVIFFHHPPYVTEATKWQQGQTLAVRHRLRGVFEQVGATLDKMTQGRPVVDVIFNGHAHCLEHLRTGNTGYADSHINYIVCGGSGRRPRRQRQEGTQLMETFNDAAGVSTRKVADSLLYVGRSGYGSERRKPYSCVRVDVKAGFPAKFVVTPLVTERIEGEWCDRSLEPFII
ncbi:metallophosphoesterase [Anabaena cylindrica FACHB-243]|uniref:Metallophosphoesterase n=1 Tax=Anabaena cylindrica (strain ATCC 27899 / PCC 7122) TaxID=272123 RepID=K9ZF75_ANACC|nr:MULTISPECIES: metallophosphoesterase [Anabaena]AFZ57846.1 metallophosphoesterase [Anabaena cylindrica PCC 7122]MBD2419243.1 metallophosphoesterase [Anabaena cylindrica FACHB-243]MBY5281500.1 metallophosphoesterase [Anabaena sp. CCAP 1446/1C]MBY5307246.1 metallophosphoesterase [Anabaena sp. CCAP 1446/1C]MCM2408156.1 metallophosphoesterase [Anabaena sp. CCAP 1446/1C]